MQYNNKSNTIMIDSAELNERKCILKGDVMFIENVQRCLQP
jgi:hypothetical protein